MGLFKRITNLIPPDEIEVSGGVRNLIRNIAEESEYFNTLVFEYGNKCYAKKLLHKVDGTDISIDELNKLCKKAYKKSCHGDWDCLKDIRKIDTLESYYIHQTVLECLLNNLRGYSEEE